MFVAAPYFEERRFRKSVVRDGRSMTFSGWQRPLTAYTDALEAAGFLTEAVREPLVHRGDGRASALPWHLWLHAVRPA